MRSDERDADIGVAHVPECRWTWTKQAFSYNSFLFVFAYGIHSLFVDEDQCKGLYYEQEVTSSQFANTCMYNHNSTSKTAYTIHAYCIACSRSPARLLLTYFRRS